MGRIKIITSFMLLMIVGILSLQTQAFAGGGWPQEKGSGFFKLGQYMIYSGYYSTPAGDIVDITSTGFYSTSIYGEYGITDRFTVISYIPFFVRSTLNRVIDREGNLIQDGDYLNSFGDTDISFKYGIITGKPVVLAASFTLGIPLGESSGGRTGLLQAGDGEFNQMITLEASASSNSGKLYGTLLAGFNNRTNNFSEEIRYGIEVGYHLKKFWFINKVVGIKSLFNGDDKQIVNNGIFNNNMEYLSITPEISFEFGDNMGINVSTGFALYARKVLASPSFSLGAYFKL